MKVWKKLIAVVLCTAMMAANQPAVLAYDNGNSSPYQSTQMGMRTGEFKENGDEIILVESKILEEINYKGDYDKLRERVNQGLTPNSITKGKTIPSANIKTLDIKTASIGVVLEPVEGADFTIDYISVGDINAIQLDAKAANGTLSIDIIGSPTGSRILNTAEKERTNVIRIGIPACALEKINVTEEKISCILVSRLTIPVQAKMINGIIRIQDETVKNAVDMEASSGDLLVIGKEIAGSVKLSVTSGDAVIKADSITGAMELNATSGDLSIDADQIKTGTFKATSGDIRAYIGTILERVDAEITSGDMKFHLLKQPTNLKFEFDGTNWTDEVSLPNGWTDGYTVGNGKPVLRLGVSSGDLDMDIGMTQNRNETYKGGYYNGFFG